ncbi:MAG: hypothetical protein GC185_07005 [Alphaproteobacteria bacterium]|nr:hypothetical protein [Alphaproteobacteria bacterium]
MKNFLFRAGVLCACLFLLALPARTARADDDGPQTYANGNSTWEVQPGRIYKKPPKPVNTQDGRVHTCRQTADCAAVIPPCGRTIAFNKAYAKQAQDWYDYVRLSVNCISRPDDSALSPVCRGGVCIMAPPGPGVPEKSDPAYCQEDADCAAVTDGCGRISAVNTRNAQQTQARMDAQKLDCPLLRKTWLGKLSCTDHLCKAAVSNYPPQQ